MMSFSGTKCSYLGAGWKGKETGCPHWAAALPWDVPSLSASVVKHTGRHHCCWMLSTLPKFILLPAAGNGRSPPQGCQGKGKRYLPP